MRKRRGRDGQRGDNKWLLFQMKIIKPGAERAEGQRASTNPIRQQRGDRAALRDAFLSASPSRASGHFVSGRLIESKPLIGSFTPERKVILRPAPRGKRCDLVAGTGRDTPTRYQGGPALLVEFQGFSNKKQHFYTNGESVY